MNNSLQKRGLRANYYCGRRFLSLIFLTLQKKEGRFIKKPKDVELPTSVLLVLPDRPPPSQPPLPAPHLHQLHLHQLHHHHLLMPLYSQEVPPTSSSPIQVLSLDGGGEQRGVGDADGEISFLIF